MESRAAVIDGDGIVTELADATEALELMTDAFRQGRAEDDRLRVVRYASGMG